MVVSQLFLKVNARYTSQTCSFCGNREKKMLSERVHNCKKYGIVLDRDLNASINIKNAGVVELVASQLMTRRVVNAGEEVFPKTSITHTFTQNTQ